MKNPKKASYLKRTGASIISYRNEKSQKGILLKANRCICKLQMFCAGLLTLFTVVNVIVSSVAHGGLGLEMEAVVLHRVRFLENFCPIKGQDFKPSAAPLYLNLGQVPPRPPRGDKISEDWSIRRE